MHFFHDLRDGVEWVVVAPFRPLPATVPGHATVSIAAPALQARGFHRGHLGSRPPDRKSGALGAVLGAPRLSTPRDSGHARVMGPPPAPGTPRLRLPGRAQPPQAA